MKIQDAIAKIQDMGFTASLWQKAGKQRIYISFNYCAMKKEAGFIGSDKTEFVTFDWMRSKAETTGVFMTDKNNKLAEIASWEIEWNEQPKKNNFVGGIQDHHYTSKAERDRIESLESWEFSHDL